jgi:hypothetical protein
MCERERRPLCDLWCFQFGCRIVLYPLALLGEPEEGPQSFQFLGTGKRAILPLLTETPQSDQIKLHKKPQTTSGRKVLHTFGEHLVFADCGNVEVAGLHVRQKILPRLIDRYGRIGLFSFCIVLPPRLPTAAQCPGPSANHACVQTFGFPHHPMCRPPKSLNGTADSSGLRRGARRLFGAAGKL